MAWRNIAAVLGILLGLTVSLARAQTPATATGPNAETELQRRLDSALDMTLEDTEVAKAFDLIAAKAKIAIVVDTACYDCLPYGATVKVSAKFRASSLRASLDAILGDLGLEQSVAGASVVIRPTPVLLRIGRRADWTELKLLKAIRETPLDKVDVDWTPDLRNLLGRPDLLVKFTLSDPALHEKGMAQVRTLLPCSVAQALDAYAAATGQIWTVQCDNVGNTNVGSILVMPMRKWIERQLHRYIVVTDGHNKPQNTPLRSFVPELSALSRIRFQPEPGLYQAVPSVLIYANPGTVQETLDALTGTTGISYEIQDDGILLRLPGKSGSGATTNSPPPVGQIAVPLGKDGLTFDLFIRESDLPPELNEALTEIRKKKLAEAVESLRQPVTPPTTTPGK